MGFDIERIYNLLPAVHRVRDAEQGEQLKALLSVIADQVAVIEEDLAQLGDDQFVETAASWVLPYIADLLGVRGLPGGGSGTLAPRAEVANTIAYRRRKGTAAVLESLARDLTGLPARAVEFFQLLATTQYMNHVRPRNKSFISVRNADRLESLGSPFERRTGLEPSARPVVWVEDAGTPGERRTAVEWSEYPGSPRERRKRFDDLAHTADVRRIARGRGRYNIPNIGIFLWRLRAYPLTLSPAVPAAPGDTSRFFLSPLGCNMQLFNLPATEDEFTHLAEPVNVPVEITRRLMRGAISDFYGRGSSISIQAGGVDLPADAFKVCDLSDAGGTWAHTPPAGKIAIDPVLGRIAFPSPPALPLLVSVHYGFSAAVGGGEYNRSLLSGIVPGHIIPIPPVPSNPAPPVPPPATIADALAALVSGGTVSVNDSGRYPQSLSFAIDATGRRIELRAGGKHRPTIVLDGDLEIKGEEDDEVTLDGLLIVGGALKVTGSLRRLRLRHCTLVPGIALNPDGTPRNPGAPSLIVRSARTIVEIENCILGGIRTTADASVGIINSIVDAGSERGIAYAGTGLGDPATAFGGAVRIEQSTVIGKVHADAIDLISNSIMLAEVAPGDDPAIWKGSVQARRRQEGCVRFSFIPAGSRVPRRYYCQPRQDADEGRVRPVLSSLRYGEARYCQLAAESPEEIRRGADDESEMGVFHDLFQPRRESYLRTRLDEYLRFGLEAGIFYAT